MYEHFHACADRMPDDGGYKLLLSEHDWLGSACALLCWHRLRSIDRTLFLTRKS